MGAGSVDGGRPLLTSTPETELLLPNPQAQKHCRSGFCGHTQYPGRFIGAKGRPQRTAQHDELEPFVHGNFAVLKNRSELDREGTPAVVALIGMDASALPG